MLRDSVFVACTRHAHKYTYARVSPSPRLYLASTAFHDPHTQREAKRLVVSLRLLTKPVLLLRVIAIFDDIRVHLNPFIENKNDSEIVTIELTHVALEYVSLYIRLYLFYVFSVY